MVHPLRVALLPHFLGNDATAWSVPSHYVQTILTRCFLASEGQIT